MFIVIKFDSLNDFIWFRWIIYDHIRLELKIRQNIYDMIRQDCHLINLKVINKVCYLCNLIL